MKKIILFAVALIISCSSPEPIDADSMLYKKDDKSFLIENDELYSGPAFKLHDNGKLRLELNYKDGKVDGSYKSYYENGELKIESFLMDGKKDGIHKTYYENGQLEQESPYKNDKRDGFARAYHENGQPKLEGSFKNDKLVGITKMYYENGQLKSEAIYKDGKLDGIKKDFYSNGQLKSEAIYKDGKRDGPQKSYDENGKLIVKRTKTKSSGSQQGVYDLRNGEVVFRISVTKSGVDGILNYNGFSSVYGVEGTVSGTIKNNILYEDGVMRVGSIDSSGRSINYQQWTIPKR